MNTLLTETINDNGILINLNNVACFISNNIGETTVYFNDDSHVVIKECFDKIVDMLHGD